MIESVSRDADPLDALAEEFLERLRRGEQPTLTEYADRHPELAQRIRDVFPALVEMEQLATLGRPTVPRSLPPWERLGDYRIVREIGRGGMGVVYEAVQESLGRRVALKVLPSLIAGGAAYIERFHREAKAAAKLHHTNIVPVFGNGEVNGTHFFAMQYIEGCSLDQVLAEVRQLRQQSAGAAKENATPREPSDAVQTPEAVTGSASSATTLISQPEDRYFCSVARLGAQAASALGHAHAQGVLHRDVKPSNLLLDAGETLWVTDFGLAKVSDSDNLTQSGDVVGTLRYMAPERFRGQADARSDVYALGATLYEMLTLRPAFESADRATLIRQIVETEPTPPRRLNARVPRDLETIVLHALAKEPGRRYATADALAVDLQCFLAGEPIQARPAGVIERTWRWCGRHRLAAALATSLLLSLTAGLVVSIWQAIRATRGWDLAGARLTEVIKEKDRADEERDGADAINSFLLRDLLGQADIANQAFRVDQPRDPDVKVRTLLDRAAKSIEGKFAAQPLVEAGIRHTLGNAYFSLGEYEAALVHLERARELRAAHLDSDHPDLFTAETSIAVVLMQQGKYDQAQPLLERLLETTRARDGEHHPRTLTAKNNLASINYGLGKYHQAESMYREVLKAYDAEPRAAGSRFATRNNLASLYSTLGRYAQAEELLEILYAERLQTVGPDHPETMTARANLARVYTSQGRYGLAEDTYRATLAAEETAFGRDHPIVLRTRSDLAELDWRRGKYRDAEDVWRQILDTAIAKLGVDHPDTLTYQSNLASLYRDVGRYEEAKRLYVQCLGRTIEKLGPEHTKTIRVQRNLAILYAKQSRYRWAEAILAYVIERFSTRFAPEHPEILNDRLELARIAQAQARLTDAEPIILDVLAKADASLGRHHHLTLLARGELASLRRNQSRNDEAAAIYDDVIEAQRAALGAEHPATLATQHNLARLYWQQGKYDRAQRLLETVLDQFSARFGNEFPDTLMTMCSLGDCCRSLGKEAKAEPLFRKAQSIGAACLGKDHPITLRAESGVAELLSSQGKLTAAVPMFQHVLQVRREREGHDHPDTLHVQNQLGVAYWSMRRYDQAEILFQDVLQTATAKLGTNHPDTLLVRRNLAAVYDSRGQYDQAEPMLREILELQQARLGPEHREVLLTKNNLATLFWHTKRFDMAIAAFSEVLEGRRKLFGNRHPDTIHAAVNLAVNYRDADRLDDAVRTIEEWLPRSRSELGVAHPKTQFATETGLSIYDRTKNSAAMEPLLRDLADVSKSAFGAESADYSRRIVNLGFVLVRQEKWSEAEPVLRECLTIREKTQAKLWTTFNTQAMLGAALLGQKKYEEAEPLLVAGCRGMLQRAASIPADAKARLTEAIDRLVEFYSLRGRTEEAARWAAEKKKLIP